MKRTDIYISENAFDIRDRATIEKWDIIVLHCLNGSLCVNIEGEPRVMKKDDMLVCKVGIVGRDVVPSSDLRCRMYFLRLAGLNTALYRALRTESNWWKKLSYIGNHPIFHLNERQIRLCDSFSSMVSLYVLYSMDYKYTEEVFDLLAQTLFYEVLSWINEMSIDDNENCPSSARQLLFHNFSELVRQKINEHREVKWYAEQLCVMPKYLSAVSRQISGKGASQFIQDIIVQDISEALLNSDLSIKEICWKLGFTNFSFFCRFVHKHLGMTPMEYRASKVSE